jgi:hypothetical protein
LFFLNWLAENAPAGTIVNWSHGFYDKFCKNPWHSLSLENAIKKAHAGSRYFCESLFWAFYLRQLYFAYRLNRLQKPLAYFLGYSITSFIASRNNNDYTSIMGFFNPFGMSMVREERIVRDMVVW